MQVTNNYQDMSAYQKPITEQPASQTSANPLELSAEKKTVVPEMNQEQKDQARSNMVGLIEHQSKKSQVEIYLSVATDSKVESNDTMNSINTLRDVQKQNNAVAAYATYQENQGNVKPTPMEG